MRLTARPKQDARKSVGEAQQSSNGPWAMQSLPARQMPANNNGGTGVGHGVERQLWNIQQVVDGCLGSAMGWLGGGSGLLRQQAVLRCLPANGSCCN